MANILYVVNPTNVGVEHFQGEDYSNLMIYGNVLDVSIYHQISNLFKSTKHSKVIGVRFKEFDEIYDSDIGV